MNQHSRYLSLNVMMLNMKSIQIMMTMMKKWKQKLKKWKWTHKIVKVMSQNRYLSFIVIILSSCTSGLLLARELRCIHIALSAIIVIFCHHYNHILSWLSSYLIITIIISCHHYQHDHQILSSYLIIIFLVPKELQLTFDRHYCHCYHCLQFGRSLNADCDAIIKKSSRNITTYQCFDAKQKWWPWSSWSS